MITGNFGLQEMYYRHMYASMQPSLEQRCESWENYCLLFNIILNSQVNMQVSFEADHLSVFAPPADSFSQLVIACCCVLLVASRLASSEHSVGLGQLKRIALAGTLKP